MFYKVATVVLGAGALYLGYKWVQNHKRNVMAGVAPATTGTPVGDPRGARNLAIAQTNLGPKAVADGAKAAILGPELASAKAATEKRRVA